jgi:hypothetical protein
MKRLFVFRFIGILAATSLLAACGSVNQPTTNPVPLAGAPVAPAAANNSNPTPAIPNAKGPDACTFLTREDVSQVLGVTVDAGTLTGLGGVCTYTTKDVSIDLTVTHTGGAKYLEGLKAKVGDTILAVNGVGDAAVYNTFASSLIFSKGDAAYLIGMNDLTQSLTSEDKQAKQQALAMQMLTHLP